MLKFQIVHYVNVTSINSEIDMKRTLSPFTALVLLAKQYRNASPCSAASQKFKKINHLFLMGVQSEQDHVDFKALLKDPVLKNYVIAFVEESDLTLLKQNRDNLNPTQRSKYDQAHAKLETINNDPVRRYFESILCHETVKNQIDVLDSDLLEQHFKGVFKQLGLMQGLAVKHFVYESNNLDNILARFTASAREYITPFSKLKEIEYFRTFIEDDSEEDNKEEILQQRVTKMQLIVKTAYAAMSAVNVSKEGIFPLDLYNDHTSSYAPHRRGRTPRKDSSNEKQIVKSNNLGLLRSYHMPAPGEAALYESPAISIANQFSRASDKATYVAAADVPQHYFRTQVNPFSNSISGTMLCQFRVMSKLLQEEKFVYSNGSEQLKMFMKHFVAYMIVALGGHSLMEFTDVWELPEVKDMFKVISGFSDLNLRKLFQEENEASFKSAMDKTIAYSDRLTEKYNCHHELFAGIVYPVSGIDDLSMIEQTIKDKWELLHSVTASATDKAQAKWDLLNRADIKAYYKAHYTTQEKVELKVKVDKGNKYSRPFTNIENFGTPTLQSKSFDLLSSYELEAAVFPKLSQAAFLQDVDTRGVRSKLKPIAVRTSLQARVDEAFDCLLRAITDGSKLYGAAELIIKRINAIKRLQHADTETLLDPKKDQKSVIQAFATYQGKLTIQDVDTIKQSAVLKFILDYKAEKELQYYEASLNAASLGNRIDNAWRVLMTKSSYMFDKQIAKEFLCYILDLNESSPALNAQLTATMRLRDEVKQINPDYIPGRSPFPEPVESASFARQVDEAWRLYSSAESNLQQKEQSQAYLVDVLNIKHPEHQLHNQIKTAIELRCSLKNINPNFVPGRSSMPENAIDLTAFGNLKRTEKFRQTDNPTILSLFKNKEILDAVTSGKLKDKGGRTSELKKTIFYNSFERDMLRVDIQSGLLKSNRRLMSTNGYNCKGKENFAGVTLNVHGELSIFYHNNFDITGIAHTSPNQGKPVVFAGEVKIEEGKLIAITDHSGHYRPTLYNVYKLLCYFVSRGVDISETKLLTHSKPKGVVYECSKEYPHFYESKAQDLLYAYKAKLRAEMRTIEKTVGEYHRSRSSFWYQFFHNAELSRKKANIAYKLIKYLQVQEQVLDKVNNFSGYSTLLTKLQTKIDELEVENERVCISRGSAGQFAKTMERLKGQTSELVKALPRKESSGLEIDSCNPEHFKEIGKVQR